MQELSSSLDVSRWEGGEGLQRLYTWLLERLVAANVAKDAAMVAECREVVEPLRDAWHEAANQQSSPPRELQLAQPRSTRSIGTCAGSPGWWTRAGTTRWSPSSRPADLPALPRVFVARAAELLERAQALATRVADLRDRDAAAPRAPRRPAPAMTRTPSAYLDQRV